MIEIDVEYATRERSFAVFFVGPGPSEGERPGVLVCPAGDGLSDHARERVRRLAASGYAAFAPDLFGGRFESRERNGARLHARRGREPRLGVPRGEREHGAPRARVALRRDLRVTARRSTPKTT